MSVDGSRCRIRVAPPTALLGLRHAEAEEGRGDGRYLIGVSTAEISLSRAGVCRALLRELLVVTESRVRDHSRSRRMNSRSNLRSLETLDGRAQSHRPESIKLWKIFVLQGLKEARKERHVCQGTNRERRSVVGCIDQLFLRESDVV